VDRTFDLLARPSLRPRRATLNERPSGPPAARSSTQPERADSLQPDSAPGDLRSAWRFENPHSAARTLAAGELSGGPGPSPSRGPGQPLSERAPSLAASSQPPSRSLRLVGCIGTHEGRARGRRARSAAQRGGLQNGRPQPRQKNSDSRFTTSQFGHTLEWISIDRGGRGAIGSGASMGAMKAGVSGGCRRGWAWSVARCPVMVGSPYESVDRRPSAPATQADRRRYSCDGP
jgi:hypothetical protein